MTYNPLQFALTREDPQIELRLLERFSGKSVLAICSGGDTLLSIKHHRPQVSVSAFDLNPAQLEHFREKLKRPGEKQLLQHGNFESLFRQLRKFINEFILSPADMERLFTARDEELKKKLFSSKYWPVAFDLHFHDALLLAMFGEAAIQHAVKGSYPRYFQQAFERGLGDEKFHTNPFLQHLLLGDFLHAPEYYRHSLKERDFQLHHGDLFSVPQIGKFDLIQLSNIFDWSSLPEIERSCRYLGDEMKRGALILIRQINSSAPVGKLLEPKFTLHQKLGDELQRSDRSLFYSNILVAEKK